MILDVEKMNALGRVQIQLFDADGNLKEEQEVKNLVVTTGIWSLRQDIKHFYIFASLWL